jgi:hypothetical protein
MSFVVLENLLDDWESLVVIHGFGHKMNLAAGSFRVGII